MTGAVTWEVLIWVIGIVGTAAAAAAIVFGWAYSQLARRDAAILKLRDDANLAIEAVEARSKMEAEGLARQFAAYQLHFAETFATKAGVTGAVERVETAVDRLGERIDRLLELHAAPPASRPRRPSG
jgi:hypothetical protein